jgi:beta-lactam-binding protein with PASTA domain
MRVLGLISVTVVLTAAAGCGRAGANETALPSSTETGTGHETTSMALAQGVCTSDAELFTGVPSTVQADESGPRTVPDVRGNSLPTAICRILAAGFAASTAAVVGIPNDRLENLVVLEQQPAPDSKASTGATISITKFDAVRYSPPPVPTAHPETIPVPDVVGMAYTTAIATLEPGLVPVVDLEALPLLPPAKSVYGLDAYVVAAQMPAAGTELPFLTDNPLESQVRLTLVLRP